MKSRSVILALAMGVLVWGAGGLDARAGGLIPLPTTLDMLASPPAPAGNFTTNGSLEFSNFQYSTTGGPAPSAINVLPFNQTGPPAEVGLTFQSPLSAGPGAMVDAAIIYQVTALQGTLTDAFLSGDVATTTSDGLAQVAEIIKDAAGNVLAQLVINQNPPGPLSISATLNWAKYGESPGTSIFVEKDIFLTGGSGFATLSIVDQGFSSNIVPEPTSMALLGIGMTGFFAFRRFFRRPPVA